MLTNQLSLDDLDIDIEVPADDDIGEPLPDYEFELGDDDVTSFNASDLVSSAPSPAPVYSVPSRLSDDDLLEVWFRLEDAGLAPQVGLAPVVESGADEEEPVSAEVIAITARAIAKAALAAKPLRRRRRLVVDERQLALF
jgi:hypothetical protein